MAGFVVKWTCCIVWECSQGLTYRQVRNVTELYGWIFKCGWRSPKPKNVGLNTGIPSFFNGHKIHFFDEWNRWRCVFFLTRIFLVLHILSMSMFLLLRQRSFIIPFWSMFFLMATMFDNIILSRFLFYFHNVFFRQRFLIITFWRRRCFFFTRFLF